MSIHPNQIARILVKAAIDEKTMTYTELGTELGRAGPTPGLGLGKPLDTCQEWLKKNGLPPLTTLVVSKLSGRPSADGTFFGRKFGDMTESEIRSLQDECFAYKWTAQQLKALGVQQ